MVLRIKDFNILGVHWKIRLLRGEGVTKNQYRRERLPKKGEGLGLFPDLGGDLARKRGWCFWVGVETQMHTIMLWWKCNNKTIFNLEPDQKLKRKDFDKERGKTHTLYHKNIRAFGWL